jgi:hypothetical protein
VSMSVEISHGRGDFLCASGRARLDQSSVEAAGFFLPRSEQFWLGTKFGPEFLVTMAY